MSIRIDLGRWSKSVVLANCGLRCINNSEMILLPDVSAEMMVGPSRPLPGEAGITPLPDVLLFTHHDMKAAFLGKIVFRELMTGGNQFARNDYVSEECVRTMPYVPGQRFRYETKLFSDENKGMVNDEYMGTVAAALQAIALGRGPVNDRRITHDAGTYNAIRNAVWNRMTVEEQTQATAHWIEVEASGEDLPEQPMYLPVAA